MYIYTCHYGIVWIRNFITCKYVQDSLRSVHIQRAQVLGVSRQHNGAHASAVCAQTRPYFSCTAPTSCRNQCDSALDPASLVSAVATHLFLRAEVLHPSRQKNYSEFVQNTVGLFEIPPFCPSCSLGEIGFQKLQQFH